MTNKNILKKLVEFNTVEDKDNQKIISWLSDFLRPLGFDIEIFQNKDGSKKGILARTSSDPCLGFLCHTDTVPAGPDWKTDPFSLVEKDGNIFGLGVSDMKGGIAACLSAISQFDMKESQKDLELLFTYDEEDDFSGVKDFINSKKLLSKYVIVPEPTDLQPMVAAKGYVEFKIAFKGVSAHGSEPQKGENAILPVCRFISEFGDFFNNNIAHQKNDSFPGSCATYNVAKINGGDAINKVPDRCVLEMECRTIRPEQNQEIYKGILEIISNFNASVEMELPLPCFFSNDQNMKDFFEGSTGKRISFANFTTEANFFNNSFQGIILGPGPVTAHKSNEYISIESLNSLTEVYKKAIERYCF